jgi:hypothetical protein
MHSLINFALKSTDILIHAVCIPNFKDMQCCLRVVKVRKNRKVKRNVFGNVPYNMDMEVRVSLFNAFDLSMKWLLISFRALHSH